MVGVAVFVYMPSLKSREHLTLFVGIGIIEFEKKFILVEMADGTNWLVA